MLFLNHAQRLPERLPWEYTKEMISSGLAGRLVYREGLQYVEVTTWPDHIPLAT